jgi:hypothetical protein
MEIRMVLDRIEPPHGTVRWASDADEPSHLQQDGEIRFTGWLGMLRALSDLFDAVRDRPS